jgi:hypothetical protein
MSSSQDLLYERLKVHFMGYNPEDSSMKISINADDLKTPRKYLECYDPIRRIDFDFIEINNRILVRASYRITFRLYYLDQEHLHNCWDKQYRTEFFKIDPRHTEVKRCSGEKCRRYYTCERSDVWCQRCRCEMRPEDYTRRQRFIDSCLKDEISFDEISKEAIKKIKVEDRTCRRTTSSSQPFTSLEIEKLIIASKAWNSALTPAIPRIREEECRILIKYYETELFTVSSRSVKEIQKRIQSLNSELQTLTQYSENVRRETLRRLELVYENPQCLQTMIS